MRVVGSATSSNCQETCRPREKSTLKQHVQLRPAACAISPAAHAGQQVTCRAYVCHPLIQWLHERTKDECGQKLRHGPPMLLT
jgi:hypothetical protein